MTRSLLVLSLALVCLPTHTSARMIRIVYVEPVGELFTVTEQVAARAGMQGAIDFWQALAPNPVPLLIASERTITATGDIFDTFEWSRTYFAGPPDLTIFVIDSSHPLMRDYLAQSQTALGLIWALRGAGDDFAATLAHELGHVVYGLPHVYDETGIMGLDPTWAYQHRWIGCASLAALGRSCHIVWLPVVRG